MLMLCPAQISFDKMPQPCQRFLRGRCTFGDSCKFAHDAALAQEFHKSAIVAQFPNQCVHVIHGQRRCKNAALVNFDSGLCSVHHKNQNLLQRDEPRKTTATVVAVPPAISSTSKRISASHKRMQNPESVREPPARLEFANASAAFVHAAPPGARGGDHHDHEDEEEEVILDVGCARGRWLLDLAVAAPRQGPAATCHGQRAEKEMISTNKRFLGLELRADLAAAANAEAAQLGLGHRVQFRGMNCKNPEHWEALLHRDGGGSSSSSTNSNKRTTTCTFPLVAIQFPDPWAKARHRRRRLVDAEFVDLLLSVLFPDQGSSCREDPVLLGGAEDAGAGGAGEGMAASEVELSRGDELQVEDQDRDEEEDTTTKNTEVQLVAVPVAPPPGSASTTTSRSVRVLDLHEGEQNTNRPVAGGERDREPGKETAGRLALADGTRQQQHCAEAEVLLQGQEKSYCSSVSSVTTCLQQHLQRLVVHAGGSGPGEDEGEAEEVDAHQMGSSQLRGRRFVYFSTDREDLMAEMEAEFEQGLLSASASRSDTNGNRDMKRRKLHFEKASLTQHPLGLGTERDRVCEHLHRKVWRILYAIWPATHEKEVQKGGEQL